MKFSGRELTISRSVQPVTGFPFLSDMVLDVYLRKLDVLKLFAVLNDFWSIVWKEREGVELRNYRYET